MLQKIGYKLGRCLKRNTPTILTCIGGAGVILTAVTAVKATPKALKLLETAKNEQSEELTKLQVIQIAGPCYIPSALVCLSTIACIVGANILNKRQQAALSSAYALVSTTYKNYKNKVKELYGEETHQNIIDSIVKEKVKDTNITANTILGNSSLDFGDEGEEKRLFYDSFSNRYFESTISKVLQAEYHLNRNFALGGDTSLNDFYEFLGLEQTDYGSTVGWSMSNGDIYWIDFNHNKATLDDGLECYIIEMIFEPTSDFLEEELFSKNRI